MIFKILRTLSSPTAVLKLEVSGKRKKILTRRCEPQGYISCLFLNLQAGLSELEKSNTPTSSPPPPLPQAPLALFCHSPPLPGFTIAMFFFFWARFLFVSPDVSSRESRHMCELQMKTVNKGRQDGSREQGGPCRHMEFIPTDAKLSSRCVWMPGHME